MIAIGDPGTVTATVPLGDGVVWASTGQAMPGIVAHSDAAGTRELVRFPSAGRWPPTIELQLVDGQLGVERIVPYCLDSHDCRYAIYTDVGTDLLTGPGLARVGGCSPVRRCARVCGTGPALAVGGGAVAIYHQCVGPRANPRATVTEADGTTRVLSGVLDVHLAGPWAAVRLASIDATAVVVRRADWTEVARLRGANRVWLQPDGTVLAESGNRLRVAGPPDWKLRDVARLALAERVASFAAGRLLLFRRDANVLEVTVRTTDGRAWRRARLGVVSDESLGFDGTRITWARPCAVTNIVSWDLEADPAPPRIADCGAAQITSSRAALHGRRVRVSIACPVEHVRGCSGVLRVAYGIRLVDLGPGREAVVPVTLPQRSRRIVRRNGRLRASAEFVTPDSGKTRATLTITAR